MDKKYDLCFLEKKILTLQIDSSVASPPVYLLSVCFDLMAKVARQRKMIEIPLNFGHFNVKHAPDELAGLSQFRMHILMKI